MNLKNHKIAIVVEAVPPHCGGGEQVAWIHAVELAKNYEVAVVTLGETYSEATRDNVQVYSLPRQKRNLFAYLTTHRALLNRCIERISPTVIHCHMPNELAACLSPEDRLMVSTIHDGVPENEQLKLRFASKREWLRFKIIRRINVRKSDLITCVSQHNRDTMRALYPKYAAKFSFIPNPIYDRFFANTTVGDDGYVLNFGRQIPLKVAALLQAARQMCDTRFVFVGSGEMVKDYGLPNVEFVGFSDAVESYIDRAALCVFPSLSENFPLVGLEAMARGKPVIATRRGFSEYIDHLRNGYLLNSADPQCIREAISTLMKDNELRSEIARNARATAENYRPKKIIAQYAQLYSRALEQVPENDRQ